MRKGDIKAVGGEKDIKAGAGEKDIKAGGGDKINYFNSL